MFVRSLYNNAQLLPAAPRPRSNVAAPPPHVGPLNHNPNRNPNAPALPAGVAPVPPGVLKRLFDLVAEIKESDTYTEAIGLELGVVGSTNTAEHAAPKLRIEVVQGPSCQAAQINFTKFGHNGILLECSVNGAGFQHLAIDTESPYLEARALAVVGVPEVREYRARFWDKGTPNGEWTDVVKVTVGP